MPGSFPDPRLTPLQLEVLHAFCARAPRFFLTGGAALAGFHLGHRDTKDLDLFTTTDSLEDGERALRQVASEIGAGVEAVQTAPDFRRRVVRRGTDLVVVDLVRDRAPQLVDPKPVWDGIPVDPPEEILANKLSALLGRAEIRDLVDVRALELSGLSLTDALAAGARKDGSLTPGQLAWVLSQIAIGDDAEPPGGVSVADLRTYLANTVDRLARLALPDLDTTP